MFVALLFLFLAAAFINVPLERMADPTDTEYVPRPEWYFLFLFQLLKVFPGRLELLATLVLPAVTIGGLVLLPFLPRTQVMFLKGRIQSACFVVLAFSIWLGLTTAAGLTAPHSMASSTPSPQAVEWARLSPEAISGSGYFRALRCDSCHNLIIGTPKPGPTLGLRGLQHTRDWILTHLSDESRLHSNGQDLTSLSLPQRNTLVIFVASLKPESLQTLSEMSPDFVNGAQTFVGNACASCHKVNGIGGDIGPSLNGLANRRNVGWVEAHFIAPRKLSPGSIMPPYHFTDKDERDLISYLFSLSQ
jgi:ubiquinol-cytochrome c reductase cytochrome b subunit